MNTISSVFGVGETGREWQRGAAAQKSVLSSLADCNFVRPVLAIARLLPLANYAIGVAVVGAEYHAVGESSSVSLTALDTGFAGCLCGVA